MGETPFTHGERGQVASVGKALDILEVFTPEQPEMSLGEIAARLNLGKPGLHKILQTLVLRGYVTQDAGSRRYRLGLRAWQAGTLAVSSLDVRQVSAPHLRELALQTGEQVTLWVLERESAVCVDRVDSPHRVRSYTRLGAVECALDLSAGRCLLAFQDCGQVLTKPDSVSDVPAGSHETQLAAIRTRGYDVNAGELWVGIRAVSAPVRGADGNALAAITVSAPAARLLGASMETALAALLEVTGAVSLQFGYAPSDNFVTAPESAPRIKDDTGSTDRPAGAHNRVPTPRPCGQRHQERSRAGPARR